VRAKPSFTAVEKYSSTGSFTKHSMRAVVHGLPAGAGHGERMLLSQGFPTHLDHSASLPCAAVTHNEGLLHDARNLMGALGLYCDLLSMPGVLKPEHGHYAEEVRLLGSRSAAMIQQLMAKAAVASSQEGAGGLPAGAESRKRLGREVQFSSLRMVAERCSGLLRRVGCGRAIEIRYGVAAAVPVEVSEEAVERILVNLVRNAAAALGRCDSDSNTERSACEEEAAEPTAEVPPGTIRIGIGLLVNRVGDPKPWPFRRVRLTVEDSGCGMGPEQLERLLCGGRAPSRGNHGIGFQVVRELVEASNGDLRVMSALGSGTRVQIEWPIAGEFAAERECGSGDNEESEQSC
jgi:signal transduction histidine kinase